MDAFLSQIQPYLDQAQIAARQLYAAAMANPTTTSAFAAVFLLLVFLRRRRRRKAQIADQILDRHEAQTAAARSAAPRPADADAPQTPPAVPVTPARPAPQTAPQTAAQTAAPQPAAAPAPQTAAQTPTAAQPARNGAAPLVLDTPALDQTAAPDTPPRAQSPVTPSRAAPPATPPRAAPPATAPNAAAPAPATPPQAAPTDAEATKRAATGPKVIHVLRRITRAAETGHSVEIDVPLSKLLADTSGLSQDDLDRTIDFGIFDTEGSLIAAIEDHTDTPKGQEPSRDAAKREALRQAGIPVTELLAGFTEAQLAAHLNKLMGAA